MKPDAWSSTFKAVAWLVLAVAALIWSFFATGTSMMVTVTVVVAKVCGGVVHATWWMLKGVF